MSFLLHTARKLSLKREISELTLQQTRMAERLSQKQKEVADFQQMMTNAKDMVNIFVQGTQSNTVLNAVAGALGTDAFSAFQQNGIGALSQDELGKAQQAAMMAQMASQQTGQAISAFSNSIFEAVNKTQLAMLEREQKQMSMEKDATDTRLKLLQEDYNSAKKAEDDAIKDAVPTFGLG